VARAGEHDVVLVLRDDVADQHAAKR
jgi:hypothetical protein